MVAYDPAAWHDFCNSFAGAAGALLGLAFVAISFNLDAILENEQLPGRAIGTLVFFAYPLGASLLIEVPGLSRTALGIGQGLLAAGLVALATTDLRRWRGNASDPLSWRLTHLVPDLIVATLASVGTFAVLAASIGGLYWIAGAMAFGTTFGLINSWVLLVEIKR
jgi:modulator of FtsH protease